MSTIEVVPDEEDTDTLLKLLEDDTQFDEYYDPEDEPETFIAWLGSKCNKVTESPAFEKIRTGTKTVYAWTSWGFGKTKTCTFYLATLTFMMALPMGFAVTSELALIQQQIEASKALQPGAKK